MRSKELDIARGFTVFIMPAVHVLMLYSTGAAQASWLGKVFAFMAEGPGAPLFMFLMGVSFHFSKRTGLLAVLKRAGGLLVLGYVLNFLKFTVLQLCGLLPAGFIQDYNIYPATAGIFQLLFMVDILQFAVIALTIIYCISLLKPAFVYALVITGIIVCISPVTTGIGAHYLLDMFTAEHGLVFFPVFPWLAYPLAGFAAFYILNKSNSFTIFRNTGFGILAVCILLSLPHPGIISENFYKTAPLATAAHIAVVLVWLWLCHVALPFIESSVLYKFLSWLSHNILSVYIIQWVVICWLLPVAGYKQHGIAGTIGWMILITAACFFIAYLKNHITHNYLRHAPTT